MIDDRNVKKTTKPKQVDMLTLLRSADKKARLLQFFTACAEIKAEIEERKEILKDGINAATEELGISSKDFNLFFNMFCNSSFDKKLDEIQTLEFVIEKLMETPDLEETTQTPNEGE